ncbi:MAG: hypothetical protein IGS03_06260 [Candidatus Sericytochromatia bacterium]|nr:hypothetical protein [Candidatus Sericytochromatia bacterium]
MSYHRLMLIQTLAPTHNGQSDQPHRLLRDADTGLPLIRSTTLMGALRKQMRDALYPQYQTADDWKSAAQNDPGQVALFGTPDAPAGLQCTPAQLLMLPVRCPHGVFTWVTSPQILKTLAARCPEHVLPKIPQLGSSDAICSADHPALLAQSELIFEELAFQHKADTTELIDWLQKTLALPAEILKRLAIISDHLLLHFARHAMTPVVYHNASPGGLRQHLECLPAQSWLYSLFSHENPCFEQVLPQQIWLGSHRSTGQGFCRLHQAPEQTLQPGNTAESQETQTSTHEETLPTEQEAA